MIDVRVFDLDAREFRSGAGEHPHWHVLVLGGGTPLARVDTPALGPGASPALVDAVIARPADFEVARRALAASLRERLGAPLLADEPRHRSVSVVVCTHRRPEYVATMLAGLTRLDPAPEEIVVVDNDPGEQDCRAEVQALGLRYVREDRRGLDVARNTGIAASHGEIVAFTDDDCVAPPTWLRSLDASFADPNVAAVTGPGFPYLLDTPARVRMERVASLARGLERVAFDWSEITPAKAGAVGVGANMAFARAALAELGPQPFPPELDAGTPTESGGDTLVIARMLARGHRVLYEPDMFVFHQHRPDAVALYRAVFGYGVGLSAALCKLLTEDHELEVFAAGRWLVTQYLRTQWRRALGREDGVGTRLAWAYVRGAVAGPWRWRRSRALYADLRTAPPTAADPRDADAAALPRRAPSPTAAGARAESEVAVTVVIPTVGDRHVSLRRCLASLAAQDLDRRFEVVLVDDAPEPVVAAGELPEGLEMRILTTRGAGTAAARNAGAAAARGTLIVFLDDDVIAAPALLDRHLAAHADGSPRVVVGPYRPRPRHRTLIAVGSTLWWNDLFGSMHAAVSHGFTSVLTGNLSVTPETFHRVGGFAEAFGRHRREDWEWGVRVCAAGVPIAYEPSAEADHEFTLDTPGRLSGAQREGFGDWLLVQRAPAAAAVLPIAWRARRASLTLSAARLTRTQPVQEALRRALDLLERGRLRTTWSRLFGRLQSSAYQQGLHDAGWTPADEVAVERMDVALDSDEPIAPPRWPALLQLTIGGRVVASTVAPTGMWTRALARQMVDALSWTELMQLAADRRWLPVAAEAHPGLGDVEVLVGEREVAGVDGLARAGATISCAARAHRLAERLARGAQRPGPPLIAIVLAGVTPDRRWLDEALPAFDGAGVGVAWGGALPDEAALAPAQVRDSHATWARDATGGAVPCFAIVRRELAGVLAGRLAGLPPGPSGDVATILAAAVAGADLGGRVVRRDTHGLGGAPRAGALTRLAWAEVALAGVRATQDPLVASVTRAHAAQRTAGVLARETIAALRGDAGAGRTLTAAARVSLHAARRGVASRRAAAPQRASG